MNSDDRGLCVSCENEVACLYRASGILQCEEFQLPAPPARKPLSPKSEAQANTNGRNPVRFLGLCSNCDSRETCLYPKPDGGIWRCEEYV